MLLATLHLEVVSEFIDTFSVILLICLERVASCSSCYCLCVYWWMVVISWDRLHHIKVVVLFDLIRQIEYVAESSLLKEAAQLCLPCLLLREIEAEELPDMLREKHRRIWWEDLVKIVLKVFEFLITCEGLVKVHWMLETLVVMLLTRVFLI